MSKEMFSLCGAGGKSDQHLTTFYEFVLSKFGQFKQLLMKSCQTLSTHVMICFAKKAPAEQLLINETISEWPIIFY